MSRLLKSFQWALYGLKYCIIKEKNFQLHCAAAVIAVGLGLFLHLTLAEWIAVIICITLVLAFEMVNTAIEQVCNIIHPAIHPSVKIIKDVSAGAVFLIAIMAAVCGAIIFIPKIIFYFSTK